MMRNRWDELQGKEVRDKVTGFTGICTGQTRWMYGCDQYCITPKVDEKGKSGESQWFDDGRIEAIGDGIRPDEVRTEKNGGCDLHPSESRR